MMNIAVIGCGVVGSATADGLERIGNKVVRIDPKLGTTIEEALGCDVAYICVPTPQQESGKCDTSIVESVIKDLKAINYDGIIAIKSTVTPDTTRSLDEAYNLDGKLFFVPEFLRERSAFSDFVNDNPLLVVGTTETARDEDVAKIVYSHGDLPRDVYAMTSTEAEILKYYNNTFNAVRVIFANVFYEICQKMGANYDIVKDAFMARGIATDMYMDCNHNLRGFSGPCLPKDMAATSALLSQLDINLSLIDAAISDNSQLKPTVPAGMRHA